MSKVLEIENNPKFSTFSYEDQLKIRSAALNQDLSSSADFVKMPTQVKTKIFEELLYRPPKMENPDAVSPQHWKRIMQGLNSGNDNVINEGLFNLGIQSMPENSVLVGLANLVIGKTAEIFGGEEFDSVNRDRKKFLKYIDYKLSSDARTITAAGLTKLAAGGVGLLTDMIPMYGSLVGTLAKPAGIAKAMMTGVSKQFTALPISRLGILATGKVLPAALHSVAGGAVGVLRETTRDFLEGSLKDQDFLKTMVNSAKYFGEYALGDFAAFTIGGMLKGTYGGITKVATGTRKFMKGSNDEYFDIMRKALANEKIDKISFARMIAESPHRARTIALQQTWGRVANNIENASKMDLMKILAGSRGYDVGADFVVRAVGDEKILFKGKTLDEAGLFVTNQIKKQWKPDEKTLGIVSHSASKVQLTKKIRGTLGSASDSLADSLSSVITPIGGRYNTTRVNTFVKGMLKGSGAADDIVRSVKVNLKDDLITVSVKGNELIKIPQYVSSGLEEKKIVSELVDNLSGHLGKESSNLQLENFMKVYGDNIKTKPLYSPSWADDTVRSMQGTIEGSVDKGFKVTLPQKETLHFKNYEEVGNYILKDSLDETAYRAHLAYHHNANLQKGKKYYTIKHKGTTFGINDKVENWQDLIDKYPQFQPKIPSHLGPKFTLIDDGAKLTYAHEAVTGKTQDILNELSKFSDITDRSTQVPIEGGRVLHNTHTSSYELFIPEINHRERFRTLKKVRETLSKGSDDLIEMQYKAGAKGYALDIERGHYVIRGDGNFKKVASNTDELETILRNVESPQWAPEVSGLESYTGVEHMPEGLVFKPLNWLPENPKGIDWKWHLGNFLQPTDTRFVRAAELTGDTKVLNAFRNLQKGRRDINSVVMEHFHTLDALFKRNNGKVVSKKNRRLLRGIVESGSDDFGKVADNLLSKKLSELKRQEWKDEYLPFIGRMRDYFGKSTDEGLFKYFGVDPEKFVFDYMPRLQQAIRDKRYILDATDGDLQTVLKSLFGERVPTHMDVFFKHARTSDLKDLVKVTDPLELFKRYIMTGVKNDMLGDDIVNFTKLLNDSKIPKDLKLQFGKYINDVMSIPTTGMQDMQNMTKKMAQSFQKSRVGKLFKAGERQMPEDVMSLLISNTYMATMGARPYLALRNMQQIWTTVAPRLGDEYVYQALLDLAKDKGGKIYQRLANKGILKTLSPVGQGEVLGELSKKSLGWFRNSDDFTRAIAWRASELRFDKAFEQFKFGKMKPENFLEMSGMLQMAPDQLSKSMLYLNQKQPKLALDVFAENMVTETLFPYQAGMGTNLFRGSMGKLFGQFGHYPLYYITNIRRGWQNASKNWKHLTGKSSLKFKAEYATQFLGNSFALAGAVSYAGFRAQNFLPWGPATFTGGPYFEAMNKVMTAIGDQSGYEGRQARAEMFGITTVDGNVKFDLDKFSKSPLVQLNVPLSLFGKSFIKGIKALNDGDYVLAAKHFGSAPVVEG